MKGGGVKLGYKREDIQKYQAKNISLLKTQMSNLVYTTRFWNNLYPVPSNQKIGKSNNSMVFRSNKPKGPKQDSQTRQQSLIPEVMNLISF